MELMAGASLGGSLSLVTCSGSGASGSSVHWLAVGQLQILRLRSNIRLAGQLWRLGSPF